MGFRLTPRSMTLDNPELLKGQILSEFRLILRLWEATTAKQMKIDLQCQRRNCRPWIKCTYRRCIDYVDILWRSAAGGRQTREVWGKQAIFELNASISRKR